MNKNILFLNYQMPFSNTAHSICFTNLFYRFMDHYEKDVEDTQNIKIFLLGLNVQKLETESGNANFEYFKKTIADKIKYSLVQRKFPHLTNNLNIVYAFLEFIRSGWLLRQYVKKNDINTVFCYSDSAFFLILFCLSLKIKFIFDCKGDRLSEMKYNGRSNLFIKLNALYLNFLVRKTSKIFISSSKLEETFKNLKLLSTFSMNTNYYDDNFIKFKDPTRKNNKVRFVYSGSTVKYQMINETLQLFKYYYKIDKNAELLLLIRDDIEMVRQKIGGLALDPDSIIITLASSFQELNDYLNTCDIAIMLREENLINFYSFPTKFAEYLAAGLPVISTKGVYDTYSIIIENNLGIIIDLEKPLQDEVIRIHEYIAKIDKEKKQKCAEFAHDNLSWNKNIARIYKEITSI